MLAKMLVWVGADGFGINIAWALQRTPIKLEVGLIEDRRAVV